MTLAIPPHVADAVAREAELESWALDEMPVDTRLVEFERFSDGAFYFALRTARVNGPVIYAWVFTVGVVSETEVRLALADDRRFLDLLCDRLRAVRALHLLALFVQFPLWWEGESVLDGAQ